MAQQEAAGRLLRDMKAMGCSRPSKRCLAPNYKMELLAVCANSGVSLTTGHSIVSGYIFRRLGYMDFSRSLSCSCPWAIPCSKIQASLRYADVLGHPP